MYSTLKHFLSIFTKILQGYILIYATNCFWEAMYQNLLALESKLFVERSVINQICQRSKWLTYTKVINKYIYTLLLCRWIINICQSKISNPSKKERKLCMYFLVIDCSFFLKLLLWNEMPLKLMEIMFLIHSRNLHLSMY